VGLEEEQMAEPEAPLVVMAVMVDLEAAAVAEAHHLPQQETVEMGDSVEAEEELGFPAWPLLETVDLGVVEVK
jgi:hypothetical protein